MIIDKLLEAIFAVIGSLLTLLPDMEIEAPDAIPSQLGRNLYAISRLVPVTAIVYTMGLTLVIRIALQVWDFLVFVYHQFWGSN